MYLELVNYLDRSVRAGCADTTEKHNYTQPAAAVVLIKLINTTLCVSATYRVALVSFPVCWVPTSETENYS